MKDPNRAERLKAALRSNLKRRKVQLRARREREGAPEQPAAAEPTPQAEDGTTTERQ